MSTTTVGAAPGVKQKKPRKSNNETFLLISTSGVPQNSEEPNLTIKSKPKRSKLEEVAVLHSIDTTSKDSTEQRPLKEKKRKRTTDGEEAQVKESDDARSKKKREKKAASDGDEKKQRKEGQSEQTKPPDDKPEPRKKRKKERNGSHDLPDPEHDTSLTDQARRGLSYAFLQSEDPGAWKFNKARQNWLIRNVWSEQFIPDTYMPLVLKYLANVKGGVRENLIQQCREVQVPLPAIGEDPPKPTSKHQRARAILGALGVVL